MAQKKHANTLDHFQTYQSQLEVYSNYGTKKYSSAIELCLEKEKRRRSQGVSAAVAFDLSDVTSASAVADAAYTFGVAAAAGKFDVASTDGTFVVAVATGAAAYAADSASLILLYYTTPMDKPALAGSTSLRKFVSTGAAASVAARASLIL